MKKLGNKSKEIPEKWWQGGTLQASTLQEWHHSTFGNGLATASAWVHAMDTWSNKTPELVIRTPEGQLDPVKYLAASLQMVTAITESSRNHMPQAGYMKTSELALLAAYALGWLNDSSQQPDIPDSELRQNLIEVIRSQKVSS